MTLEELRHLRYGGHFRPFRVVTKKKDTYNVLYPELLGVFGDTIVIGNPGAGATEDLPVCDELHHIRIEDIDRVEMLPVLAAVG